MEGFNKVVFLGSQPEIRWITVERLKGRELILSARGIQRLLRTAYERQLESPYGSTNGVSILPRGTVRHHLANEDDPLLVLRQVRRLIDASRSGDEYWVIRDPFRPKHLTALAKIGNEPDGSVHIKDILAHPPYNGYGSAALRGALVQQDPQAPVYLEGYNGSTANSWFERLGLQPQGTLPDSMEIGKHVLLQTLYSNALVGDVNDALVARHPSLKSYEQLPG